ncbi:MAG: OOP family OmpA-OmpF porin [Kiritimatiellia bacterium]|jgi:OOP family OmpA-OmpF porin
MIRLAIILALGAGFTAPHTTCAMAAEATDPASAQLASLHSTEVFESNSTEINNSVKPSLNALAKKIIAAGPAKIEIGVHTDSQGSGGYNKALSQKRAESVRDYLIFMEVPRDWLTATGYGEDRPIASNQTTAGRDTNRRIDVQYLGQAPISTFTPTSTSRPD